MINAECQWVKVHSVFGLKRQMITIKDWTRLVPGKESYLLEIVS